MSIASTRPWLTWLRTGGVLLLACGGSQRVLITADGQLSGEVHGKTQMYLGVPYAEPPVGALRFSAPSTLSPWADVREARVARHICPQMKLGSLEVDPDSAEDCLYLNVWAPKDGRTHPVMVYFPGGAYVIGAGSQPEFEGTRLSEAGNVVVVTANYRLAAFGFLAHPALRHASKRSSGDYGLLDQREVLAWVQRNAAAFGGDPSNVTLFGESAGAGSACMHLVSPGSAGLFQRAILESTPCTGFALPTRDEAEAQGQALVSALGCERDREEDLLSCLRAAPMEAVLHALALNSHIIYGQGVGWGPVVDGVTVPDQPVKLLAGGASKDVALIVGANADEGTLFFSKGASVNNAADVREAMRDLDFFFGIDFNCNSIAIISILDFNFVFAYRQV